MSRTGLISVCIAAVILVAPAEAKMRKVEDYSATIGDFKKIDAVVPFLDTAVGYAVFPTIGRGGLGIGGSHGKGQVYTGGEVIGFSSLSDISAGFRSGGQAYSQLVFFQTDAALEKFTSGNFEFSAGAEAIAVQAKAEARASTETTGAGASATRTGEKAVAGADYQDGLAVFTMAKGGLMHAATIAGQKYTYKLVGAEEDEDEKEEKKE